MATSYHKLGILAQDRGDYDEAARQYQRALDIYERLGDQAGMATSYHQLGILAQCAGTTTRPPASTSAPSTSTSGSATRPAWPALPPARHPRPGPRGLRRGRPPVPARPRHQRAARQPGRHGQLSYHQLGILAQDRGDYDEAARQYQRALDINERLGNQAGMAASYHQLGMLAQDRGDYDEAARQYQRALDINERLGDQAGMAASYHQLGILAQLRGDYDEAARQYQRALDINERLGDQAGMASRLPPARHPRPGPRGLRRGRPPVPALPRHQRAARQPGRHGQPLQPARHPRPGPRGLRRGRPPVPALPRHQRAARQPGRHGQPYHQLGMLAQDRGDYDEAARQYQRALDINERLGDQADMATSYSQLGILEKERGGPHRSHQLAREGTRDQAPPGHPPGS